MLSVLGACAADASKPGLAIQLRAVLRFRGGSPDRRGGVMTAPDDVVGAALVLVRAAQAPPSHVEYFSQRNCEQLLGLTKRAFLEILRRSDAPRTVRLGKSRLVRRVDMIEFLERLSLARSTHLPARDGADEVLADLGCVVPRSRRGA